MHGISLVTIKETEGVVEALAQMDKYEKETRLKKVLKNVIEITAGGEKYDHILKNLFWEKHLIHYQIKTYCYFL